jgi:hypothetical protein
MREGTVTFRAEELAKKSKGSVVQTLPCFLGKLRIAALQIKSGRSSQPDQVRQVKSEVRIQNAEVKLRAPVDMLPQLDFHFWLLTSDL